MKISKSNLWLFATIFISVIIITLVAAPASNQLNSGSTYGRSPDGYGAWYAFMLDRKTPLQRWQKPFQDLVNIDSPITLLRVYSRLTILELDPKEEQWLKKGNTLVILGVRSTVTKAPFSSIQDSLSGKIKIDTRRRNKNAEEKILGDRFGAIVWKNKIGKGEIIYCATPHLAANAYQDFQDNYKFLARLVTQKKQPILIDEYIHGYKDLEVIKQEKGDNIFSYLSKTPLFPAFIQTSILLFLAFLAGLYRFGQGVTLKTPVLENSQAYIQALAAVLQKAESTDFVFETISKEEQIQLQKALGLGETLIDTQSLVEAWVRQTGRCATELEQVLAFKHPRKEANLLIWIKKWQDIRHLLKFKK
jgi:Domain of unknown function (DUF4350)